MLLGWLALTFVQSVSANHQDEQCVTAVFSAYNYISFAGFPTKGMWDTRCRNPLEVASIYASTEIYCDDIERVGGLARLAAECQEFGHQELLPRDAVAENLTENAIRNMRKVDYQELSRAQPVEVPVMISQSYFDLMFNTIVRYTLDTRRFGADHLLELLGVCELVASCL
jgi:ferric-chelate reductase